VLWAVARPPTSSPLSILNHMEREQPCNHTDQASSGPMGRHVACTDQGLQIPVARCFFLKLFTRFSAFSKFLCSSVWIFSDALVSYCMGNNRIKFGWGRAANTKWYNGSSNGNRSGFFTLKNDRYATSSAGEIDCVANNVKTSNAACCKSVKIYYTVS